MFQKIDNSLVENNAYVDALELFIKYKIHRILDNLRECRSLEIKINKITKSK